MRGVTSNSEERSEKEKVRCQCDTAEMQDRLKWKKSLGVVLASVEWHVRLTLVLLMLSHRFIECWSLPKCFVWRFKVIAYSHLPFNWGSNSSAAYNLA
jgi:hypothetical protein